MGVLGQLVASVICGRYGQFSSPPKTEQSCPVKTDLPPALSGVQESPTENRCALETVAPLTRDKGWGTDAMESATHTKSARGASFRTWGKTSQSGVCGECVCSTPAHGCEDTRVFWGSCSPGSRNLWVRKLDHEPFIKRRNQLAGRM